MQLSVGQVVLSYLVFLTLALIEDDVDEVLLPDEIVLGALEQLLCLLLVIHLIVNTGTCVKAVSIWNGSPALAVRRILAILRLYMQKLIVLVPGLVLH